jgi:mono/diheme cytochrome c family protein
MLAMSIVRKGDPAELSALLALLDPGANELTWRQRAVLTGLSTGGGNRAPIRLAAAPAVLARADGKVEASRLAAVAALFEWPGHRVALSSAPKKYALSGEDAKRFVLGRQHYLTTCAGCHGTDGAGITRFAPPLAGSDWVLGDEKRLALIVLHGMEGPVQVGGKKYDAPEILPVMPAHSTMDDATITAILTYIRNAWGNDAGPVGQRTVGMTRVTSQGRVVPWKADELNNYVTQTQGK